MIKYTHLKITLVTILTLASCAPKSNISLSSIEDKTDDQITKDYTILKDVSYGDHKEQGMDIYLSKEATQLEDKNFTVVFLHGGGYYLSDKSREERYIQPYLKKGLNVVNMNYRLKKGIPIATEDLTIALNFLKSKSNDYPLNLENIIVTGFSAGAQIASTVGLSQNNSDYPYKLDEGIRINGIINFSGPTDRLDIVEDIFVNNEIILLQDIGKSFFPQDGSFTKEEVRSVFEPINYFDKNDPPFFLWYGGKDDQVPPTTAKEFVVLLNKDKNKNKAVYYPDAGHSPNKVELKNTYDDIFQFLDNL
ncbi:alpha/beta hydrolase fold domain-containing protein [Flavobacteriaceae bacterium R38]|nr:alpha/beta hydrolase fold domain-containing protein [Flavobacteriaceae bacterium R38]